MTVKYDRLAAIRAKKLESTGAGMRKSLVRSEKEIRTLQ